MIEIIMRNNGVMGIESLVNNERRVPLLLVLILKMMKKDIRLSIMKGV